MLKKIYKDLFDLAGTSGYEKDIRIYMRHYMEKFPNYEIKTDRLGSIFAVKKAQDPNAFVVMVAGHMDEVGLIVTGINEFGMLKLQNLGSLNGEVLVSQVLNVYTKNGVIKGIIGALPPHLKAEQSALISDLILDVGASSKEEALSFGVLPGDMVLYDNPFAYTKNPNRIISKSIDNRYGCGLALETIEKFNDVTLPFTLVVGATVQEEVGLRGAETAVQTFNPDVFLALDASPVNDMEDKEALGALGKGFLLRMYDPRNVMHQGLMDFFIKLAKKHQIDYQYFVSKGGTDAAKALDLNAGVLATTIGLPARYIHSTAAMMDLRDLESAKKMLFQVLKTLNPEVIKKLKESNS
ncbi:MAG: M20/M25/M40 family metallo-hydrolase [Acholeplasmataceae bacterium]|nr:M20/M25/M40 family metallo-hydrolase [Acholeplasmataceae bacterium]